LLNLAIVLHVNLNNRSLALQKYRAYLALTPRPANWEAVNVVATELNQLLNPAPAPMPTNSPPINRTNTGTPRASLVATQSVISSKPVALPTTTRTSVVVSAAPPVEVTQVSTQRVVQPVQQLAASRSTAPPAPVTNAAPAIAAATKSEKRTVLQRINPLNLFRRNKGASPSATASNTVALRTPAGGELTLPRYEYHPLEVPAEGDHAGAEPVFAEGVQAERANDLPKAVQSYRRAAELDPAYFDAQYRLGIASAGAGNLPQALRAYETALTIQPESVDARISFSQALKQANYPLDAAAQLEEVLTTDPNNARAHLNLGNLYAQQLRQPARAREHYLKVLELDPRNPRASDIRFWLAANPP
jgi:tetratricopeptide (TPR) repeat protein